MVRENYKELAGWAAIGRAPGFIDEMGVHGGLPTHNWSKSIFEDRRFERGAELCHVLEGPRYLPACPIACKQVFVHEDENPRRRLNEFTAVRNMKVWQP